MGRKKDGAEPSTGGERQPKSRHERPLIGLTEDEMVELEKVRHSHPAVDKLIQLWEDLPRNSVFSTLVSVKVQLAKWNEEVRSGGFSIRKVADPDGLTDDTFKNVLAYFKEIKDLLDMEQELIERIGKEKADEASKIANEVMDGMEVDFATRAIFDRK
jgi:hypothetical protein